MSTKRQSGLTIVELILFIVIIGVAAAAVLQTFATASSAGADPVRRKQALLIAEGLLEEVQLAAFTFCDPTDTTDNPANVAACAIKEDIGPEPGTPGRPFDNVNDYATLFKTPQAAFNNAAGVLVDASGVSLNLSGYTARLTLRAEPLNGIPSSETPAGMDVLRATVAVSYGAGANDVVTLDAYRTRYAPQVAQ